MQEKIFGQEEKEDQLENMQGHLSQVLQFPSGFNKIDNNRSFLVFGWTFHGPVGGLEAIPVSEH